MTYFSFSCCLCTAPRHLVCMHSSFGPNDLARLLLQSLQSHCALESHDCARDPFPQSLSRGRPMATNTAETTASNMLIGGLSPGSFRQHGQRQALDIRACERIALTGRVAIAFAFAVCIPSLSSADHGRRRESMFLGLEWLLTKRAVGWLAAGPLAGQDGDASLIYRRHEIV